MRHWWAAPAVLASITGAWLIASPLYTALRQRRRWSWLLATAVAFPAAVAAMVAVDRLTPEWGTLRKFAACALCWMLLVAAEEIHEHRTGKPLVNLPEKQDDLHP